MHNPPVRLMRRAESYPANRDGHFEIHCSSIHGAFGALCTESLAAVADEFPGQRLIKLESLHSTFTPSSLNWGIPSRNLPNQHADLQAVYQSSIDDPDREGAQCTLRIWYNIGVGLQYDEGWFGDNENLYWEQPRFSSANVICVPSGMPRRCAPYARGPCSTPRRYGCNGVWKAAT